MVIVIFLPKPHAPFPLISVRGLLFETLREYKKIANWRRPKGQEMQVVRHYTISVHHELAQKRFGSQDLNNPCGSMAIEKNWLSALAAHRKERPSLAEVFLRGEPVLFTREFQLDISPVV
jgi:hypothetical protein